MTGFVGRGAELHELASLLAEVRGDAGVAVGVLPVGQLGQRIPG